MAVSGSLTAGSLFGHSRQYDEKVPSQLPKLKLKGPAAIFMLSKVSHEPEQCQKAVCTAWGVLGTCTGTGDGLHDPTVLLHKYDQRNYFCGPKVNLKSLQCGGGEGTPANLYESASKHCQSFSEYFTAFNTVHPPCTVIKVSFYSH